MGGGSSRDVRGDPAHRRAAGRRPDRARPLPSSRPASPAPKAADGSVVAAERHVDHGNTTLVRAMTGMEPDRLASARRRVMTIDLGYAWTTLPTGAGIAFVDVPGHQRF